VIGTLSKCMLEVWEERMDHLDYMSRVGEVDSVQY
jgi:hypothetical protein